MMFYHVLPFGGDHTTADNATSCHCEPEIRKLRGGHDIRIVVHQGVTKQHLMIALQPLFSAYPGRESFYA